jgi:hypothetical protein
MIIERRRHWHISNKKTYLQHLHKHINDVSDGIIRPGAERFRHLCPDLGENSENNIFKLKLKLHKHGKSMVSAQQAVLSSRNCPEVFRWSCPSFPMTITRMMASSPCWVRAARERV